LGTVAEAQAYGPLANQLLQTNTGASMSTTQVVDLLALASSDLVAEINNPIVTGYYTKEITTLMTNAVQLDYYPVQYYWNPYVIRPTIIAMATQVATFDLASRYNLDFATGWLTFRFAQDQLFNYEPFDFQNQFLLAYEAGWNYIPREIKLALFQLSYLIQTTSNIEEMSDGSLRVKYTTDKNIARRIIFNKLRIKYML
jgi:hypothetical protein